MPILELVSMKPSFLISYSQPCNEFISTQVLSIFQVGKAISQHSSWLPNLAAWNNEKVKTSDFYPSLLSTSSLCVWLLDTEPAVEGCCSSSAIISARIPRMVPKSLHTTYLLLMEHIASEMLITVLVSWLLSTKVSNSHTHKKMNAYIHTFHKERTPIKLLIATPFVTQKKKKAKHLFSIK